MNYIGPYCNLRLSPRNEGKIKSFESCSDIRAWSHDCQKRCRYLKEWIKCDMPISVLPTGVLAKFMRNMSSRRRCRATPRCHPDCKSKTVLDSICKSCHAMRECFKNEERFEKYFEDEEFETSSWPCERCLVALKSIKMFWKIIVEKIFHINVNSDEDIETREGRQCDSVCSVAKAWQAEMVQQAMIVRNFIPFPCRPQAFRQNHINISTRVVKKEPKGPSDNLETQPNKEVNSVNMYTIKSSQEKSTDTDSLLTLLSKSSKSFFSHSRKRHKHNSEKYETNDTGTETCEALIGDVMSYKVNLEYLQDKYSYHKKEMDKIKKENSSLKLELNNLYKNSSGWKSAFYTPKFTSNNTSIAFLPKPFECSCIDETVNDGKEVKSFDSEMIITMKNCKNESYRHISLLQVLHKTNEPILSDLNLEAATKDKKQDPIVLLTKVQNTFGAIVKREMSIANDRKQREASAIDATYKKINDSKVAPSCFHITVADSSSSSSQSDT